MRIEIITRAETNPCSNVNFHTKRRQKVNKVKATLKALEWREQWRGWSNVMWMGLLNWFAWASHWISVEKGLETDAKSAVANVFGTFFLERIKRVFLIKFKRTFGKCLWRVVAKLCNNVIETCLRIERSWSESELSFHISFFSKASGA